MQVRQAKGQVSANEDTYHDHNHHRTRQAAPAKKATTPAPAAEKKFYGAVGRSGQAVRRQFAQAITHAVDVADPKDGKTEHARTGQVWSFFTSEERATAWAAKKIAEGYDAVVTTAEVVK